MWNNPSPKNTQSQQQKIYRINKWQQGYATKAVTLSSKDLKRNAFITKLGHSTPPKMLLFRFLAFQHQSSWPPSPKKGQLSWVLAPPMKFDWDYLPYISIFPLSLLNLNCVHDILIIQNKQKVETKIGMKPKSHILEH